MAPEEEQIYQRRARRYDYADAAYDACVAAAIRHHSVAEPDDVARAATWRSRLRSMADAQFIEALDAFRAKQKEQHA